MKKRDRTYTADQVRKFVAEHFRGETHETIGLTLGLSAGFVGMVLSGAREPSKAFLQAAGFERVVRYRRSGARHGG
ncbi:hypothetical protein ACE10Z_23395 [Bradyrhizobium sp. Pha-3]|uniref:hypothetical protein n=1 Tax=Bradyrhizobium sp. Pha-3 TaxID=208375 RepID=UPI0035D4BFDD